VSGPCLVIGVTGSFAAHNLQKAVFTSVGLSGYRGYRVLAGDNPESGNPVCGLSSYRSIGLFRKHSVKKTAACDAKGRPPPVAAGAIFDSPIEPISERIAGMPGVKQLSPLEK
jgi:hypothetical protein